MTSRVESITARAQRLVQACEGAPVVAVTDGHHSLVGSDAVWWLTGFKAADEAVAAVDPHGVVNLRVSSAAEAARAEREAVFGRLQIGSTGRGGDLFGGLGPWVDDRIAAIRLIGSTPLNRALLRRIDTPWLAADANFAAAARRGDDYEAACFAMATAIAEQACAGLVRSIRPGVREHEIVGRFAAELHERGSDDNFLLMSASSHNRAVHRPTGRVLEEGDLFLAEISPSVDGVYTQICRTVAVGQPAAQVEKRHAMLCAAFQAGLDACGPGVAVSEVTAALNTVISEAGFGEYCRPPHMRVRGHGLGLGSTLPGDLTADSAVTLEEGDTFVLHPNQYLPDVGYLMCGEPLAITTDGRRLLSSGCAALEVAA